jgi:glutaredoxin
MAEIKVYGADWCSMTKNTLAHLKALNLRFEYINIDQDREGAKWVAEQNNGREKKPTLDIDGTVISEPSDEELDKVLEEKGLLKQ